MLSWGRHNFINNCNSGYCDTGKTKSAAEGQKQQPGERALSRKSRKTSDAPGKQVATTAERPLKGSRTTRAQTEAAGKGTHAANGAKVKAGKGKKRKSG